ncbi:hypothetical protein GJ496_009758 [Pomphorhynchus laevis]|nr:hypothetical protein GJ496_009758 [Pomphorhynchus laevis]
MGIRSLKPTIVRHLMFYPSDAVSTERAVELAAQITGICYIRTGRPNSPIIYKNDEVFTVGKAKVLRESPNDVCTIVASGVTLFEALKACDAFSQCGKPLRIIDPFIIKPIDRDTIILNVRQTHNRLITVEDHYPEGGLGEAVVSTISDQKDITSIIMAVNGLPRSGKCEEPLHMFKINSEAVIAIVEAICH